MLQKELRAHPIAYAILVVGIAVFVWTFLAVWPDRMWERAAIGAFASFYFLWGIFTHQSNKQITRTVIGEYAFVSILGALLLLMLTF